MRVAFILGLGCSAKNLKPFQTDQTIQWRTGLPATADQTDVVLLFGGDGTIHRHLSHLVKLGLPVLVVPAGSGNDFARAFAFRTVRDSVVAWRRFVAGANNVRAIDLGAIFPLSGDACEPSTRHESTYFCTVAGLGLTAEVSKRAHSLPRWLRGRGGYVLGLMRTVLRFEPFSIKIVAADADGICGETSDRPIWLAAFANSSTYGDGMKIAPRAMTDDGKLDVCTIGGMNPIKLLGLFPTVYSGRHLRIRGVEYFQSERLRVETERPSDIYADGEFVCRTPAEIGIERGVLKVIV